MERLLCPGTSLGAGGFRERQKPERRPAHGGERHSSLASPEKNVDRRGAEQRASEVISFGHFQGLLTVSFPPNCPSAGLFSHL